MSKLKSKLRGLFTGGVLRRVPKGAAGGVVGVLHSERIKDDQHSSYCT